MSLENAMLEHAKAINNLAAALLVNQNVIAGPVGDLATFGEDGAEQTKPEKAEKKPEKSAKARAKAKKVEEKKPESEDDGLDEDMGDEDETAKTYDATDVRKAAMSVRDEVSREELAKAFKTFKAKKISDLKEENYGPFIRHCEQLVENGAGE